MPAAVLFDLYDTIVRSDWGRFRQEAADLLGIEVHVLERALTDTRPARSTGVYPDVESETRAVIEATGIDDPPVELIRSVASAEFAFQRDGVTLEPDVAPVTNGLRVRGVRTALVSNCSHATVPLAQRLGLYDIFDQVVLSFRVGARKPDRRIYEAALRGLGGVAPEDTLFVDDQVTFCDGARALGMDTRLVIRPGVSPPEGISAQANGHVVIEDLLPVLDA
ncbi:MAG: HAD-IA family hydrolase [Actinomycetota bacterium]